MLQKLNMRSTGLLQILVLLAVVLAVSCGRIPLVADQDLQSLDLEKLPGCYFDGHFYELEDTWHPDLGPPFGVMYCVRCECLAMPRKGQVTGKVRCRNFKHECPKTDCAEPVLLPNQCCKVCPREANSKGSLVPHHHDANRTTQDPPKSSGRRRLLTGTGRGKPRNRGKGPLIDEFSRKQHLNDPVMDPPNVVPSDVAPKYTCQYKDATHEDGASWKAEHKNCTMCSCQRGKIVCDDVLCPKLTCRNPVKLDGDCCHTCPLAIAQAKVAKSVNASAGCYLDKKWHKPGSTWHPYIPPFGFTRCAICTCTPGSNMVNCTRLTCPALTCSDSEAYRENPADCCRRCPGSPFEPVTVVPVVRGANDTMSDEGTMKLPGDLLKEGGCKFQTEIHKNGAEWHPRVQPFGVMNCVLCRCKDGKPTCKRQKCPKLTCPLIRKESEECCPRCTDAGDPKARPNRRLGKGRRNSRKQRRRRE